MKYEARTNGDFAVVVDKDGKSIADIVEQFDDDAGCNVLTPAFAPDMAQRVAKALNGEEVTVTLKADASEVVLALRAMLAEFRSLDLPYGSAAYHAAMTALSNYEKTESATP